MIRLFFSTNVPFDHLKKYFNKSGKELVKTLTPIISTLFFLSIDMAKFQIYQGNNQDINPDQIFEFLTLHDPANPYPGDY